MDEVLRVVSRFLLVSKYFLTTRIYKRKFKEYAIYFPAVKELKANEIKKIREKVNVSQPVFARLLNTSSETIKKWEQGERHPTGASLKLLNLVSAHGLQALY